MKVIGVITTIVVSAALGIIWYGYVLSIIWGWYIAPTFGLPTLNIPTAFGIALIFRYMGPSTESTTDVKDKSWREVISGAIVKIFGGPAIALLFAWIIKFWM